MTPFSRVHWQKLVEEVGVVTMEILEQELCNAELMFLAALTDLAEHGAMDLESEIVCVDTCSEFTIDLLLHCPCGSEYFAIFRHVLSVHRLSDFVFAHPLVLLSFHPMIFICLNFITCSSKL